MGERKKSKTQQDGIQNAVQAFYDRHPYPPPIEDLDGYRQAWQDERKRRADFYLHWPNKTYRTDVKVLVAGCGTSQAAKHALREPASQVIGIDFSQTSVRHTEALKRKYNLTNLEVYQLPIERAGELDTTFDKVVCTGVLHHLPDPEVGLRALQVILKPDGAMNLMVYATYGRAGIYMLQEYCRLLGIGQTDKEIQDLIDTLAALPHHHPLAHLLGETPDFQNKDALADALLNPQDRAYTVPQLFDLIEGCGLKFGRWIRQAPYLPQCGSLASTPHAYRLGKLPLREQYAAIELFRGTMVRHNLIGYRDDQPGDSSQLRFENKSWLAFVPIRLPETVNVRRQLPPGAAVVLVNQAHVYPDLILPINADELRMVEAINGTRSIYEIIHQVWPSGPKNPNLIMTQVRRLFEKLYWYDQVVFDASSNSKSKVSK
jgi:SAM-dependent methyltransferase